MDNLTSEARQLEGQVKQVKGQVAKSEKDVQEQFKAFVKVSESPRGVD